MPRISDCLMADVDATLMQQVPKLQGDRENLTYSITARPTISGPL